jgi:DNA-binding GntR family transcriptional regulator
MTDALPAQIIEPFQFATKAEVVYGETRRRILSGALAPGARLNQEALAVELDVSVTPVREAVRRLLAEGLVQLEAHKTVIVAPLSLLELRDIYEVRLQLDPYAAAQATLKAGEPDIDEIERLAHTPLTGDAVGQLVLNRAFHRAIYALSDNQLMIEMLDRLWERTDRYRIVLLRRAMDARAALEEHVQIAAAMRRREPDAVERLIRAHIEKAATGIEDVLA